MFKLGNMCHCGIVPTIIKWDSGGTRLWELKRGIVQGSGSDGGQTDYSIYLDAASAILWAGGTLVEGEDEGALYQYSDTDTGDPTTDWISDRNGNTEQASPSTVNSNRQNLIVATDGTIIRAGTSNLHKYSSAGALTNTLSGASRALFPGASGEFYRASALGTGTTTFNRVNTSFAISHTASHSTLYGHAASGFGIETQEDIIRLDASTLCISAFCDAGFSKRLFKVDNTLTETASYSESALRLRRLVNSGTTCYAYNTGGGSSIIKFDLSAMTKTWTNTTMQSSGSGYSMPNNDALLALDENGDLYTVMEKSGTSVSKIQKRSPSDGSITWEHDVGDSKLSGINMTSMQAQGGVVAALGRFYNSTGPADPRHILALDASDGSLLWDDVHGDVSDAGNGLWQVLVDGAGNVYACGAYPTF